MIAGSDRSAGVRGGDVDDPPPPPPPDPRSPLTARQIFSISKSWKAIARAMEPTGVEMFVRLFKKNQDLLQLFTRLVLGPVAVTRGKARTCRY